MASLPTLADIKAALGIDDTDTTKDAAITNLLAATIAIVESYCGRGFKQLAEVQEIDPPDNANAALLLYRFPVSVVNSVTQNALPLDGWRLQKASGVLRWPDGCFCIRSRCGDREPSIVVDYLGGYADNAWPADLVEAVMRAFYGRWNATGGTGNVADAVNAGGANRSVSVDGLTITRDSSTWAGEAFAGQAVPPDLAGVAAILEPYRSRIVGGV